MSVVPGCVRPALCTITLIMYENSPSAQIPPLQFQEVMRGSAPRWPLFPSSVSHNKQLRLHYIIHKYYPLSPLGKTANYLNFL
ncbi:hypothetical protein AF332_05925 [Sporosarcina globispora]|uniref:Uncharacterized protein n=1 Tax=Sporosarcina globispora TaxID=1459 RepID=A0A0M0G9F0_SPOGL|nr:hypothetical protein AF332_05925 [Sporosarcina globispora]